MSEEQSQEFEVCDGELVPGPGDWIEEHRWSDLERSTRSRLPLQDAAVAVQAAALLASGFLAGAATMALLRRHWQPRVEHPLLGPGAERQLAGETRAYLVSVHRVV